jgi:hypothetical protein
MLDIEKDLSFVILLTEFRFAGLRATVTTIQQSFDKSDLVCVVPKDSNKEDLKTAKTICPIVEGGDTISSMINRGVEKSKRPWSLIVMSGNIIKYNPVMKYKRFLESEKDVMYRVVDKSYWKWEDASIHGVLIHKNAMKEVGAFPEDEESLQLCKLLWAGKAIEKGYKFKGLVGVKLL